MSKRIFISGRSPAEFSLLEVREETEGGVASEYLYIYKDVWEAFFDEPVDINTFLSSCPHDKKTYFKLSEYFAVKNDAGVILKLLKLSESEKHGTVELKFRKGPLKPEPEHTKKSFTREFFEAKPKIFYDAEILKHLPFNDEDASRICLSDLKNTAKVAGLDIMFTVVPGKN